MAQLLRDDGYSLQGNRKTEEGGDHPDRDAQFRYIKHAIKQALRAGEPVISVDTKKKKLIGNYQGRQWRKKERPRRSTAMTFRVLKCHEPIPPGSMT